MKLMLATWNVRTLIDNDMHLERRTAIVAKELARYRIDVAALSETRLAGESNLEETGVGYTFFWKGRCEDEHRQAGVGFAIRTKLLELVKSPPKGLSDRIMTLRLSLSTNYFCTLISAYAPTMMAADDSKEEFYEALGSVIRSVPLTDKLIVLGDFNARVGCNSLAWNRVIGKHGVGKENSNGTLLLTLCSQHDLVITNTVFKQANKYKTSWMHPRSKHWHLIDYITVRRRDLSNVKHTRSMRGTSLLFDHRLVRCKTSLVFREKTAQ